MTVTLGEIVARSRRRLTESGIADAAREARLLIGGLLEIDATAFITGEGRILSADDASRVDDAIRRRTDREPIFRILGRRPFLRLVLELSPETLEPRPDTELLVERLVPVARETVARQGRCRVLDLGTGTGAILLALADMVPGVSGIGTDIARGALETAARNADLNGVADRVTFLESDWFSRIDSRFDVIVSNPPYIAAPVIETLADEVRRFDPRRALDGGADGLDAYRSIAAGAREHLEKDGTLALEIGFDQRHSVSALMEAEGFLFEDALRDLGGNDRVLVFSAGPKR
ncbi:peptide chain release factor N(5)-glutamine methyltransferase [Rhizobium sp. TRM95111]|uniref:peptide chain release factor N(5)-glutamine methyltransferase n=1 Tax=Rhizobium alarense TaxID=2846851 RepID=UPI001F259412|nr:peptide chain release factor N(5)-glutamine methyltransferase [Rhizobium alarense]MCF3642189.1 peptide chain release factor N(5)-glutamine methyltransferase [Rhizobium alarense]